jgi:hypothetical protein
MRGLPIFSIFCVWCTHQCLAFGRIGHYVIGEAVAQLVADSTFEWVAEKGYFSKFDQSWGLASIEADNLKGRPGLAWTRRFHFFNADDDPPTLCNGVRGWNDTRGGNVLNGIERFTNLLVSGKGDSFSALMVIHLLQDLANPLHLTGKERGGNGVTVEYNGRRVGLHRLWDTVLVQELADRAGGRDALIRAIVDSAKPRLLFCAATHTSWMEDVVGKADEIQRLNCKAVWRDEMRTPELLLPIMNGLLVGAAAYSACHWDRLASEAAAAAPLVLGAGARAE